MINQKRGKIVIILSIIMAILLTSCTIGGTTFESRSDSKRRKARLLVLLEEKYGTEFEIVSARAGGSLGSTNSYNVRSEKFPEIVYSASLYNENTEDEEMIEGYNSGVMHVQSKKFLNEYKLKTQDDKFILSSGIVTLKNQKLFNELPYDLDFYAFDNLYKNHKELLGQMYIQVIYLAEYDDEVYESLNEILYEYVELAKGWNGEKLSIGVRIYDISVMDTDIYDEYLIDYSAKNIESKMLRNGYF